MKKKNNAALRTSRGDRVFNVIVITIVTLLTLIVLLPMLNIVACSFSAPSAVSAGRVLLWPVDFSLQGYKVIFNYKSVWTGFGNTIFYTVLGTILNMVLSVLVAYPLSRPNYQGRKLVTGLFTFLMMFSAGLIPTYLLMSNLHLTNTRWALILIGGISTYNMIIIRTYFKNSIPSELIEAARIDGANRWQQTIHISLPCIASTIIVMLILKVGKIMSVNYQKIILLYSSATSETADVITSYVYRISLSEGSDYSYGAAIGLFNSVVNLIFVVATNAISRKMADTGLW